MTASPEGKEEGPLLSTSDLLKSHRDLGYGDQERRRLVLSWECNFESN